MKNHFRLLLGITLTNNLLFGQINDTMNDLKRKNIAGKVEAIEEFYHNPSRLFKKGRLTRAYYTIYSQDGYIIESGDLNRITKKRRPEAVYELRYVNGKIEGRYKKGENGGMIPIFTVRYDSLNRIIELIRYYTYYRGCSRMPGFYSNDGGDQMVRRTYSYDEQGTISKCEEWDWVNQQWRFLKDCNIKDNPDPKETAAKNRFRERHPTEVNRYMEFSEMDEYGNWTLEVEYYDKTVLEIMKRKIIYYK